MKNQQTLLLFRLIKNYILDKEEKFTVGHHFIDKDGNALPPNASSIPHAAQRCIGGAIIEGLVALGIDENASSASHGYEVAMYHLGDALGSFPSGTEKIHAVMRVNNEEGFESVRKLIDATIRELER